MIKFFKTIVKLLEGIMWLYLPIILFYWALTLVNLSAFAPLKAVLGQPIVPVVTFINDYFSFEFLLKDSEVDYTPLVLAGIVALSAIILIYVDKMLNLIEEKIQDIKINRAQQKDQKEQEIDKQTYLDVLNRHKALYVMLKLHRKEQHENYLVRDNDDSFSESLVDSYETSIINIAKNFSAKQYSDFEVDSNTYNFIFTDCEKFIKYLKFLPGKVKEINKGTADLNILFGYTIACSCSFSASTVDTDLSLINKMLNLCGPEDILVTDILKDKIENLDNDIKPKFEAKGSYIIQDKDLDIFKLKF